MPRRIRTHTVAKGLATTLGISAFFSAYFWVPYHLFTTPALMHLTRLDGWVAFDLTANACPSMHVAFAVLTGIWLHRLLRALVAAVLGRSARSNTPAATVAASAATIESAPVATFPWSDA